MRKTLFYTSLFVTASLGVTFSSCSKDSNDDEYVVNPTEFETEENPNAEDLFDASNFDVSLKENFQIDPAKNLDNIVVGDTIHYNLSLTDNDDKDDVVYSLDFNTNHTTNHTKLNYDYAAKIVSGNDTLSILDSHIELKKKDYVLLIIPLQPGTFQNTLTFTKIGNNGSFSIDKPLLFNCVSIDIFFMDVQTRHSTWLRSSLHRNEFYMNINDGIDWNDNYLHVTNERQISYHIEYDGNIYEGDDFEEDTNINFYNGPEKEGGSSREVENRKIDLLRLIIKEFDKEPRRIEYKNINITKRD